MTESLIPKRKRGRPRKNPLITNEVNYPPQPPKRRATESDHVTNQNEYQWRPNNRPLGGTGFQQGIQTTPRSL